MQTTLAPFIKDTPQGQEADAILRKCVHCGFCLATCPTYQLLGDELDSPRGRIYLMKQMLEGAPVTERTQLHLDRCLTCRSCESTCPSGVQYGRLVDIGREVVEQQVGRSAGESLKRSVLRRGITSGSLFAAALAMGRVFKPLLPKRLAKKIPKKRPTGDVPEAQHARRMILLGGCVQPALQPAIDAALARVFDGLGISLVQANGVSCCGAVEHHTSAHAAGLARIRANIDAWWPEIQRGAEAVLVSATGCGAHIKDYGHILAHDPQYADKAQRISTLFREVSEVIGAEKERVTALLQHAPPETRKLAFHPPCSLQHGLKIKGLVESILRDAGFALVPVTDAHLCCGSAGAYSLLQPEIADQLLANKVKALEANAPDVIASANIGCLMHIESGLTDINRTPIVHWIELLDQRLSAALARR